MESNNRINFVNDTHKVNCQRGYGIDLSNYFPSERHFNSVVYIHKKFLQADQADSKSKTKSSEKDKKTKKKKKAKADKGQQFAGDVIKTEIPIYQDSGELIGIHNDPALEQTVQLAKNMVPFFIPPNKDQQPVYYTIKAVKKSKKHTKVPDTVERDITYKKEKTRRLETYTTEHVDKESISVKETVSYSSRNDTLNEIHIDPSLCCSFSDVPEQKQFKREKDVKEKRESQKFAISESFEALATEYCHNGDSNIKVHLMNDTDKNLLADSIKKPLLDAIKQCIVEINNKEMDEVITTMQKYIKSNTQKLDFLTEKVSCVERKIEEYFLKERKISKIPPEEIKQNDITKPKSPEKSKLPPKASPKVVRQQKLSALEMLEAEDMALDNLSEEDDLMPSIEITSRKKGLSKSATMELTLGLESHKLERLDENKSEMACGESGVGMAMGARPARMPARFCWTGGAKKT